MCVCFFSFLLLLSLVFDLLISGGCLGVNKMKEWLKGIDERLFFRSSSNCKQCLNRSTILNKVCRHVCHAFLLDSTTRLGGFRVFIGNLGARTNISELQQECERYGPLVDCWVAR